jgi:hypothetical protein
MNGGYNNSSSMKIPSFNVKKPYQEIDSIIDTEQLKWDKFRKLKNDYVVSPAKILGPATKLKNFSILVQNSKNV